MIMMKKTMLIRNLITLLMMTRNLMKTMTGLLMLKIRKLLLLLLMMIMKMTLLLSPQV